MQGTLDLLILKALSLEAMHGWGISERIQQMSREASSIRESRLGQLVLEDDGEQPDREIL